MFVKICMLKSDLHVMLECFNYSAVTKDNDKARIVFHFDEDTERSKKMTVNKSKSEVFVMNESGDTVETYRWRYDRVQERFTRI